MPKIITGTTIRRDPLCRVQLMFDPRDLWLGVYWTPRPARFDIYICLVPAFPLKLSLALSTRTLRRWRERWGLL